MAKQILTRREMLTHVLGQPTIIKGTQYYFGCQFCMARGGDPDRDDFGFDEHTGKYNCFADNDHTKLISKALRDNFYQRSGKLKQHNFIEIEDAPQEVLDYLDDRKITPSALKLLKVKWDKDNSVFAIDTPLLRYKFKPIVGDEFWAGGKMVGETTTYSATPYEAQKNFLYLEGIPDIWAIKSMFPETFFKDWYVTGTVHGCGHLPKAWETKEYWNKFERIILCGDEDEPGQKACQKIKSAINKPVEILHLPFKHVRTVHGVSQEYRSKDFNDWVIEGNIYEDFLSLISSSTEEDTVIDRAVEELRNTPNKLQVLIDDVHKLGVVGEDTIIAIVFLCFLSHKFDECLGFVIKGRFSSGKSHVLKIIASLFPQEQIIMISSFSKLALQYMFDLSHKILIQTEEPPADDPTYWEINSQLRQLISEGEIVRAIVEKDPQTHKMVTTSYKVRGPIVYGSTTTQASIHEENESRLLVLQTNDTAEHIAKVKDMLDKQVMDLWICKEEQVLIKTKWQRFISSLPSIKMEQIGLPFSDQLQMCIYGSDMIRDYVKLQKLLKMVAYLENSGHRDYPGQKGDMPTLSKVYAGIEANRGGGTSTSGKRHPYDILVEEKHYKTIYDLTRDFFNSKATKISQSVFSHYERIKPIFRQLSFTAQRVGTVLIMTKRHANRLIRSWLEENMIVQMEEKGEYGRFQYKVNEDWEVIDAELTPPEHINKDIAVNGKVIDGKEQVLAFLKDLHPRDEDEDVE